jgi:hypothetical protein
LESLEIGMDISEDGVLHFQQGGEGRLPDAKREQTIKGAFRKPAQRKVRDEIAAKAPDRVSPIGLRAGDTGFRENKTSDI